MGTNELNELRRQAERSIADSEWTSSIVVTAALGRAIMYLAEVIRDGIGELSVILSTPRHREDNDD